MMNFAFHNFHLPTYIEGEKERERFALSVILHHGRNCCFSTIELFFIKAFSVNQQFILCYPVYDIIYDYH